MSGVEFYELVAIVSVPNHGEPRQGDASLNPIRVECVLRSVDRPQEVAELMAAVGMADLPAVRLEVRHYTEYQSSGVAVRKGSTALARLVLLAAVGAHDRVDGIGSDRTPEMSVVLHAIELIDSATTSEESP